MPAVSPMLALCSYSVGFSAKRDTLDRKFWYVRGSVLASSAGEAAARCLSPDEKITPDGQTVGGEMLFALSSGLFIRVKLEGRAMDGHNPALEAWEIAYARKRAHENT